MLTKSTFFKSEGLCKVKQNLNPRFFAITLEEINHKYPTKYSKTNFQKPKTKQNHQFCHIFS